MKKVLVCYRYEEKGLPYLKAIRNAGLEPVSATPAHQPSFESISGLVLTGGSDLNPALYGQTPHPKTTDVDSERDQFELMALGWAVSAGIPVLCICRGMQLLNVFAGGTLFQDIPNHVVRTPEDPGRPVHTITIERDSQLRRIIETDTMLVNSRHHQAVDKLGRGLAVSALAPDGTVEAIEMDGPNLVLGVQWHPEDQVDSDALNCRLFDGFAVALDQRSE
jgi:putative glutamine amidotransferase